MDAAIARWPMFADYGPAAYFGLTDLFVVALAIFDIRSRGRPHPVKLWGGLLLVASQPLRPVVMGTEVWIAFGQVGDRPAGVTRGRHAAAETGTGTGWTNVVGGTSSLEGSRAGRRDRHAAHR